MHEPCAQCGATQCEERFHAFLALEFADPAYGAVHHLTVPAYMLQHPDRLSQKGWRAMRETLRAFLVEGRAPQEHRARIREQVAGDKRSWRFTKGPPLVLSPAFTWSAHITAVDDSDPAQYRRDILAWARQVLADAETV